MRHEEPRPILTVDVILFTVQDGELRAALQRREMPPFAGELALIGGYVHISEDANTLATAARVLKEKAGLEGLFLEQLMTFSGPDRDPRGWSASVAYYALVPATKLSLALPHDLVLVSVDRIEKLPFDHNTIVATAVQRLRNKGAYSSLPAYLLPPTFTLPQLRNIYAEVLGVELNDSAFRRKIDELRLIEPVPGQFSKVSARPAKLYRLRSSALREFDRKLRMDRI
jgi:8-oxo-dGTP diphosphatase